MSEALRQKVLLEYMPIHVANGFSALEQYTKRTNDFYNEWKHDNGQSLNSHIDLRAKMQFILFNSTFISCVAFFEFQFKTICDLLDPHELERSKIESNSYIQKYYSFLRDILLIDLKPKKQEWSSLWFHSEIRNKLVHAQGTIENEKSYLVKEIKKMDYVRLDMPIPDYMEIQITDCRFIYNYISTATEFLNFVVEETLKKIPAAQINTPITFISYRRGR